MADETAAAEAAFSYRCEADGYSLNIRDLTVTIGALMAFRAEAMGDSGREFYAYVREPGRYDMSVTAEDHGDHGVALRIRLGEAAIVPAAASPVPEEGDATAVAIDASPSEMAHLLEAAWDLIANAGWDGMAKTEGWQEASVRWRDRYHEMLGGTPAAAVQKPPAPPLPPGQFARVELPGYRQHTGWMTEETRAGAGVLVIRNWDGAVEAEVFPGPGSRIVHLPTPQKRPEANPQRAISGRDFLGSDQEDLDDDGPYYPDDDAPYKRS